MVIEQVSQGIHPEVRSRRISGPQGPDPPAFLYLAETLVMAVYFVYRLSGHVSKGVSFAIEVFCHMTVHHTTRHIGQSIRQVCHSNI